MKYRALQPHPALGNYIASYFFLEMENGLAPDELVIPDGTHGLMFVQQSKFTRHCSVGENKVSGSYVFGQKSRPVRYQFDAPGLFCFGAKFHPHGLKRFIEMPVSEMKDSMAEAALVLGKDFPALEDRILSANQMEEKKSLLDGYFIQLLQREEERDHALVRRVLTEIHRSKGLVEISALLNTFHLNYKRLERLFKKHVGLSPKAYCRIIRFNATLFYQSKWPNDNLTQLAYAAGYFDQMHFIKEVKHFTHLTPRAFFKNGLGKLGMQQQTLVLERFTAMA